MRNLFSYKVKVETLDKNTVKYKHMLDIACNYLYRFVFFFACVRVSREADGTYLNSYGALIVLANYLIERKGQPNESQTPAFSVWLKEHREVSIRGPKITSLRQLTSVFLG